MTSELKLSNKFKEMSSDEKLNEIKRFMNTQINKIVKLQAEEIESVLKGLSKQFNILRICEYRHGVTTEYKYIIVEIKQSFWKRLIGLFKK
jgi:hypothetical protein